MTTQTTQLKTKPTTLSVIEGIKFPRVQSIAGKLYGSKDTIFFNIEPDVLKIVEVKDGVKAEDNEVFNTVEVFMTINGVVHENVVMASVWNITAAKKLTANQRGAYMFNPELNVFAFIRSQRLVMLPLNGRNVVDVNGDTLLNLDDILSDVLSIIDEEPASPDVKVQPQQPQLNEGVDDSWKYTENFAAVLLAKVIGAIGCVHKTNSFSITEDKIVIDGLEISTTSKDPLVAVITEHTQLNQIHTLLNQNFAERPSIESLMVYDLYGGVSVIASMGFTALIATPLAKKLSAKAVEHPIHPQQNAFVADRNALNALFQPDMTPLPHNIFSGKQVSLYMSRARVILDINNRDILVHGVPMVGLDLTEKMIKTDLRELSAIPVLTTNAIVLDGQTAYLYDLVNCVVHINDVNKMFDMLNNVGAIFDFKRTILVPMYQQGYGGLYNGGYAASQVGQQSHTLVNPNPGVSDWLSISSQDNRGEELRLRREAEQSLTETAANAYSHQQRHLFDLPKLQPQDPMTFGSLRKLEDVIMPGPYQLVTAKSILKDIAITNLTTTEVKNIMALLLTKI